MSRNQTGLAKYRRGRKSFVYTPYVQLVTNNLLINFDANDITSYSGYKYADPKWLNIGTGGAMYDADLSGNIKPATNEGGKIKSFRFFGYFLEIRSDFDKHNYMQFLRPSAMYDDFTYCAWINTFSGISDVLVNSNVMYIISSYTNSANKYFGIGINNNNKLSYLDSSPTGTNMTLNSTQSVNNGKWTFVAVTRNKITGQVVLYINGIADTTGTCNTGTLTATDYMLMGSTTYSPGYSFAGNIGAILGYASILSADDILRNFEKLRRTYQM
jgi:hypothetical protein